MSARINLAGFTDPVGDAQATFRAVLDAMSGLVERVPAYVLELGRSVPSIPDAIDGVIADTVRR